MFRGDLFVTIAEINMLILEVCAYIKYFGVFLIYEEFRCKSL